MALPPLSFQSPIQIEQQLRNMQASIFTISTSNPFVPYFAGCISIPIRIPLEDLRCYLGSFTRHFFGLAEFH
jgi:hypothetical protein